jgi:hypothetical protein
VYLLQKLFFLSDHFFNLSSNIEFIFQIVLSGFGGGSQHLKLTTIMFQNIFPAIDINTVSAVFILLTLIFQNIIGSVQTCIFFSFFVLLNMFTEDFKSLVKL